MISFRRITLILLILVLALVFAWALWFPKEEIGKRMSETIEKQRQRTDLYFKGVTVAEIVNGVKYWEIKAASSDINKETGITTLEKARGVFFKKGKPALKFASPKAEWDMKAKKIFLTQVIGYDTKSERGIEHRIKEWMEMKEILSFFHLPSEYPMPSKAGYWFVARNLEWGLEDKKIICQEGLTLTKGDMTVVAQRLEADVALEKVKLTGNPKAVIE